jgi:Cu(I)/Ag(I) efflux system membrane fusion protein
MKKNKAFSIAAFLLIIVLLVAGGFLLNGRYHFLKWPLGSEQKLEKALYYCPMHPNIQSDRPGECSICYMSLVKNEAVAATADHTAAAMQGMVYISPAKQQLIGVKKQKVEVRKLSGQILTVGTVAYDPDLYVAQQEYVQAIKSPQPSEGFIKTAKQKLLLMGMGDAEIGQLEAAGKPQQDLYLPDGGKVWVYITIYEYESGLVKDGLPVEVETSAYPGQTFSGKIVSVSPIVESMTRSLKVRALVDNPDNKLKLRMYVNVRLNYDLGEKLAVPEDAVMHTGTRDIVFVADPNGYFTPKPVKLGAKAQGYYEVLDGVRANEEVVTSGNFLIDSESKLNAVLGQMAEAK